MATGELDGEDAGSIVDGVSNALAGFSGDVKKKGRKLEERVEEAGGKERVRRGVFGPEGEEEREKDLKEFKKRKDRAFGL